MNYLGLVKVLAVLWAGAMLAGPAQAGPDCSKKPDHPSCLPDGGGGGGGDGGGGGGDACAASTAEFPAFAFQRPAGKGRNASIDIVVASADGACQQSVASMETLAREISFSFNAPTGRLAWVSNNSDIWLTEFDVDGKNVQTTVAPTRIVDALHEEVEGRLHTIFGVDLSEDGQSLAFSLDELFGTTGGLDTDRWSVRTFADVFALPCTPPCSPEDAEAIYELDEGGIDITDAGIYDVKWNASGERIYVRQGVADATGTGRDLVLLDRQQGSSWQSTVLFEDSSQTLYDDFDDLAPGSVDYGTGARDVVAIWVSSNNRCNEQTYVIDVEHCANGTGSLCGPINASYAGRRIGGWTANGTLIVEEASSVEGKGVGGVILCEVPGTIAEVDLFSTGALVVTTLVEGSDPDSG